VAVIGLDAADLGFLGPWVEAGDLPVLGGLLREGASGPLRSTLPPVSAPAWATFMTGLLPGRHGLFDFVMEDPATGRPTLARSDLIRGRKLWEAASDAGKRGVVVNVPITWPPAPFEGVLVTGMLTPEGKPFTHPPGLGEEIRAEFPNYRVDYDPALLDDRAALRAHLADLALHGSAVMRTLMRRAPWDLFVGVFTTTDRAKHLFWREREDAVRDHYGKVDRAVGELLAEAGPGTLVVLLSDHGFHTVPVKFYVNRWLRERGLLAVRARRDAAPPADPEDAEIRRVQAFLKRDRPRGGLLAKVLGLAGVGGPLEVDPDRTKAYLYSIETGGIQVNLRGRAPRGTVAPGAEYEALRDRLIADLRALRFPGTAEPLFDLVERREAVYRGPLVPWAPDVVTRSKGNRVAIGRDLDDGKWLRVHGHEQGGHSDTGILALRGPGVRGGARLAGAGIEDVMPTVLWALGAPVPEGLDGRVLAEAFEEGALAARPVRYAAAAGGAVPAASAPGFDAAEEEELRRTLEGLGYV